MSLKSPLNTTDTAIVLKRWVSRQPRERFKPDLTKAETNFSYAAIHTARGRDGRERDSSRYFHQSIHAYPQINHKIDYTFPMLLLSVAHHKRYPARSTRYRTQRDALCRRCCCCTNQPRSKQRSTKVQTTSTHTSVDKTHPTDKKRTKKVLDFDCYSQKITRVTYHAIFV
ncbi:unnamed protein product [Ectocarpus sp. 12 AP-2014]